VETEVTWEDQQNINLFGRINSKFHELEDEIKAKKVHISFILFSEIVGNCTKKSGNIFMKSAVNLLLTLALSCFGFIHICLTLYFS